LGGKSTGPNPTDRSKSGTKRSLLVDGQGIPLGITVDGANRHDMKMTKATLQSIVVSRPSSSSAASSSSSSTTNTQQHICLDKGYDYPEVYELLEEYGYTMHVCKRGGGDYNNCNKKKRRGMPKYRARRWVVERTHSWMNRFRRLLIRWEKNEDNYIAMLHFVCAWITYKREGVFG
jgi:putative transposase